MRTYLLITALITNILAIVFLTYNLMELKILNYLILCLQILFFGLFLVRTLHLDIISSWPIPFTVLISRLGFILLELGSIPIENVYKIIFYNLLEIANAIVAYALIGYMFSFGKWSVQGIIGYSNDLYYNMDQVIFGKNSFNSLWELTNKKK